MLVVMVAVDDSHFFSLCRHYSLGPSANALNHVQSKVSKSQLISIFITNKSLQQLNEHENVIEVCTRERSKKCAQFYLQRYFRSIDVLLSNGKINIFSEYSFCIRQKVQFVYFIMHMT